MIYTLCKRLIALGKMDEIKLGVYYANDQITAEQYSELMEMVRK